jgi:hypothetical protein
MANMERYIFNVDADASRAINQLNKVQELMNNIENIRSKGDDNYSTTSQKDMDRAMRSARDLAGYYAKLNATLEEMKRKGAEAFHSMQVPEGATKAQRQEIESVTAALEKQGRAAQKQQAALSAYYDKAMTRFRELSEFQQKSSKDFKSVFNSNDLFNLPSGSQNFDRARRIMESMTNEADRVSGKLDEVKAKLQEVNKLDRRSESLSRRAEASGYMSHQQASSFRKDHRTATGDYRQYREENMDAMTRLGQERTNLFKQIKAIETNENASDDDINKKIAMQQTVDAIDKEREAREELNRALRKTTQNMESYNNRLASNGGVEVKPERGTFGGMVYERAPAIGLAMTGAVGGVMGGLYHQGVQNDRAMRDDVIAIGQQTGTAGADWRSGIRDNALNAGLQDRLGFSGQEMLSFQQNYLTNAGYSNMDDLNTAMQSQAVFSRTTGIDSGTTRDFFDTAFSTGAVSGTQAKDIQDAFMGAIKQSGMEGREKDQLKALQGLLGSVSQGRTMTNQEVMNTMGLQSVLAGSGVRSLSGEKGGQLMSDLNQGIRQGIDDPATRLLFGQGTKYQGLDDMIKLQEQMEKGVSDPENVKMLTQTVQGMGLSDDAEDGYFSRIVRDRLGVDISAQQARGLMDLSREGKLDQSSIDKVLSSDKETGKAVGDEKLTQYQDSKAATANQSDATTEKQATQMSDFGDALRAANAAASGIPVPFYAAAVAATTLAASMGMAAMSFGASTVLRGGVARNYNGGTGASTFLGRAKERVSGWFGRGGGGGGTPGGGGGGGLFGGWFGRGGGTAAAGGAAEAAGNATRGGAMGKLGEWGGKAGNIAGKVLLPLGIVTGGMAIAGAPEGKKAETTGGVIGGIGGGIAGGAAAGAAMGSIVPGIGTAIGGIGGGIVGGVAGSSLGKWVGGWFGGDEEEKKPKEPKEKENKGDKQVDRENTNTRNRTESKRTDNLALEKENLNLYEKILARAETILKQAQLQNGIFGTAASNSATGTVGASPVSGNSNEEKIWNFFADKGFSSTAIAGIMGNLKQESQLDPNAKNPTSGAYGIGQWLGARKTGLQNYAKETGGDASSIETQLNYLWKEMQGGDSTFTSIMKKYGGLEGLKGASTKDATNWFEAAFERSGGSAMGKRQDYAQDFYNQYGKAQMSASSASKKSSSANVNSTITVNVKADEKVSDKVNNNSEWKKITQDLQQRVYGSMSYFANEMERY